MEFSPILVTLGDFEIRWYSVLILVAAFMVYAIASKETKRFKILIRYFVYGKKL